MKNALELLANEKGWQLHKISPTTCPGDIALRMRKDMSKDEIKGMMEILEGRNAYRCRLGKGRWYYANTAEAAAKGALEGKKHAK